jgi:hypothetical protein
LGRWNSNAIEGYIRISSFILNNTGNKSQWGQDLPAQFFTYSVYMFM